VIDDYLFKKWIKTPTVLPNVVNEELIMESSRKSLAKNIDVVFLARLTHPKNPLGFIDVIAGVRKSIPGLKVVVIGDGELAEQTKAKTVGEGLEDVVEFLGFQANPYPYVKQARICVLTSVWEGYPMSALEAMLLGVPIVCTDVGGLPQMVNDSVGRVCTTLAQIEEEVIHLLSDPKYLEEKTAKTTDHARQINNVKGFKQILSSTYHRLAEMSR
jgi:glycosyltransferase involved in cell wall biosynthesis